MANPWSSFSYFPDRIVSVIETNTIKSPVISRGGLTHSISSIELPQAILPGVGSSSRSDLTMKAPLVDLTDIDWTSATVVDLVQFLHSPPLQEKALSYLFEMSKNNTDVAVHLKNSSRGVKILLHEAVLIENKLSAQCYGTRDSIRACHALSLLQCLAYHPETKMTFLSVWAPEYLYPLLPNFEDNIHSRAIRNASLRTLAALVEVEDTIAQQAVHHFIGRGVHALFLECIEYGDLISQYLATFIMTKILMQDEGLHLVGTFAEEFFRVSRAYAVMIESMGDKPSSPLLLRNIIQSYFRMAQEPRARDALVVHLPWRLQTPPFISALVNDPEATQKLHELLYMVVRSLGAFSSS